MNAPLAAKVASFAAMHRGHPADDVAHFLYSSTSKAFRDIYGDLCLRTYFAIFKVRRKLVPFSSRFEAGLAKGLGLDGWQWHAKLFKYWPTASVEDATSRF